MARKPQTTQADKPTRAKPAAKKTVAMVRDEPMMEGGPVTADVHPDEVENWRAVGWRQKNAE